MSDPFRTIPHTVSVRSATDIWPRGWLPPSGCCTICPRPGAVGRPAGSLRNKPAPPKTPAPPPTCAPYDCPSTPSVHSVERCNFETRALRCARRKLWWKHSRTAGKKKISKGYTSLQNQNFFRDFNNSNLISEFLYHVQYLRKYYLLIHKHENFSLERCVLVRFGVYCFF